jgi:hypothetical protein
MFNLESEIKAWRRQIQSFCHGDRHALDELEDHLREEISTLTREGRSEQDAWTLALAKLGDPATLRREFAKIDRLPMLDRFAFTVMLGVAVALIVALPIALYVRAPRFLNQPVLTMHIVTITLGYSAGLFAAAFAGYTALRASVAKHAIPALTGAAMRLVRLTCVLAAVFSIFGFAFGAVWAYGEWGRPFNMDPREIGGLLVAGSFLFASVATLRNSFSPQLSFTIAIAAGATVIIAWFGVAAYFAGFPLLLTAITVLGLAKLFILAILSLRAHRIAATHSGGTP